MIFSGVLMIVDVATAQQQQTESRGNKLKQLLLKAKKELAETKQLVSWCSYHILLHTYPDIYDPSMSDLHLTSLTSGIITSHFHLFNLFVLVVCGAKEVD